MYFASDYNRLPSVAEAHALAVKLALVRQRICNIIARHGLEDRFGVRLIHKHFEMKDGEVAVFRNVVVPDVCTVVFMGPVKAGDGDNDIHGKNFLVDASGSLVPFEYTTSNVATPADYPAFVSEIVQEIVGAQVQGVLGIFSGVNAFPEEYTEFEITDMRSTVMVPAKMIPVDAEDKALITNWVADSLPTPVPKPVDSCTKTRSGHHYGNCRATRNSHHKTNKLSLVNLDPTQASQLSAFDRALMDPTSVLRKVVDAVV